jgi:hypothetical protein
MNKDRKAIIQILTARDGITVLEASETLIAFERDVRALARDVNLDPFSALDSISEMGIDQLGLEPDYTEYLIHELT